MYPYVRMRTRMQIRHEDTILGIGSCNDPTNAVYGFVCGRIYIFFKRRKNRNGNRVSGNKRNMSVISIPIRIMIVSVSVSVKMEM